MKVNGGSLWDSPSIVARGDAWEVYDAARTGFERTPPNFPVFDQISHDGEIAISNKTLDLTGFGYSRVDKRGVYDKLSSWAAEAR